MKKGGNRFVHYLQEQEMHTEVNGNVLGPSYSTWKTEKKMTERFNSAYYREQVVKI
jgi:hypothetical protein